MFAPAERAPCGRGLVRQPSPASCGAASVAAGGAAGRNARLRALAAPLLLVVAACTPEPPPAPPAPPVRVIVADFVTADAACSLTLKHAVSIALAHSPGVQVLPGTQVADALRGMNRSADERVSADIAWEIAGREGLELLILGSMTAEQNGFVLGVEAVSVRSGDTVARAEERAAGRDAAIDAAGAAAWRLALELAPGSDAGQVPPPLSAITTQSVEAFSLYARGREEWDKGRPALAAPYFAKALTVDPGFSLAARALAQTR